MPVDVAQFATGYLVPREISGQDRPVRIGPCVYGRYQGIYAYKVYGEINAVGLRRNGTWAKYGESFDSAQQALDALLANK